MRSLDASFDSSPTPDQPGRRAPGTALLWTGGLMLALGTGPLVVIGVLDPKSNPIGPGLLAFFTFWPSIGLIVAGAVRRLAARRDPA